MHTKILRFIVGGAMALAVACPSTLLADFTGDEIFGVLEAPFAVPGDNLWDGVGGATTAEPVSAIVGDDVEFFVALGGDLFADFSADEIEFGIDFDGPIGDELIMEFTDLNGSGDIVDVSILSSDFDGVSVGFTADSITINVPDQAVSNSRLVLGVSFSAIPEPGTSAVLLAATAAMIVRRRR